MKRRRITVIGRGSHEVGATDWDAIASRTEEEILERSQDDPDTFFLGEGRAEHVTAVGPEDRTKVPVYIRLDADVLAFFRRGGKGYQTRINGVLRDHMQKQSSGSFVLREPVSTRKYANLWAIPDVFPRSSGEIEGDQVLNFQKAGKAGPNLDVAEYLAWGRESSLNKPC
jgi:uncharacterized protein (DUF4415 family)